MNLSPLELLLLGALGTWVWWDLRRMGKHIHRLRNQVQSIVIALQKAGIEVRWEDDRK